MPLKVLLVMLNAPKLEIAPPSPIASTMALSLKVLLVILTVPELTIPLVQLGSTPLRSRGQPVMVR